LNKKISPDDANSELEVAIIRRFGLYLALSCAQGSCPEAFAGMNDIILLDWADSAYGLST